MTSRTLRPAAWGFSSACRDRSHRGWDGLGTLPQEASAAWAQLRVLGASWRWGMGRALGPWHVTVPSRPHAQLSSPVFTDPPPTRLRTLCDPGHNPCSLCCLWLASDPSGATWPPPGVGVVLLHVLEPLVGVGTRTLPSSCLLFRVTSHRAEVPPCLEVGVLQAGWVKCRHLSQYL